MTKKPSEAIKNADDFLSYVKEYWKESQKEASRYSSWEHCYRKFQVAFAKVVSRGAKAVKNEERDCLSLWLAWYLASWGMYRGSSDLLKYNYKIHRGVIDLLLNDEWSEVNNLKCSDYEKCDDKLDDLKKKVSESYEKKIKPTDTLITKILLGTLGCSPAFDELFSKSVSFNSGERKLIKGHVRTFTSHTMYELCDFYKDNPKLDLWRLRNAPDYPQMKILDMGFWYFWFKNGKKLNKNAVR